MSKEFDNVIKGKAQTDVAEVVSKETLDALGQLKHDTEEQFLEFFKDLMSKDEFIINGKKWKRRKITYRENKEIERMSKAAVDLRDKPEEYDLKQEEIYKKLAGYTLVDAESNNAMTETDFENAEAEVITKILDAINYRTMTGLPSFHKG